MILIKDCAYPGWNSDCKIEPEKIGLQNEDWGEGRKQRPGELLGGSDLGAGGRAGMPGLLGGGGNLPNLQVLWWPSVVQVSKTNFSFNLECDPCDFQGVQAKIDPLSPMQSGTGWRIQKARNFHKLSTLKRESFTFQFLVRFRGGERQAEKLKALCAEMQRLKVEREAFHPVPT